MILHNFYFVLEELFIENVALKLGFYFVRRLDGNAFKHVCPASRCSAFRLSKLISCLFLPWHLSF